MAYKKWEIQLEGQKHSVELQHGYVTGRREIRVDGKVLPEFNVKTNLIDFGANLPFKIGTHDCAVVIRTKNLGLRYAYDLWVDGKSLSTGKSQDLKSSPSSLEKNFNIMFSSIRTVDQAQAILKSARSLKIFFLVLAVICFVILLSGFALFFLYYPNISEENFQFYGTLIGLGLLGFILNSIVAFCFKKLPRRWASILLLLLFFPGILNPPIGWGFFWISIRLFQAIQFLKKQSFV